MPFFQYTNEEQRKLVWGATLTVEKHMTTDLAAVKQEFDLLHRGLQAWPNAALS